MLVFQLGDKPCCLLPLTFLRSKWKSIVALISPLQWLVVGMMLFTTQQTWAAGQVLEYGIKRSNDGRYHVYMRPNTAISGENTSLTGQVTIKVPNGANKFWVSGLTSMIPGVVWTASSRVDAPPESPQVDFISFTFDPIGSSSFNWQPGVELEVFNFINPNVCEGSVTLLENTESFAIRPNSANTNAANQFTNLGWGSFSTNNYLGNYQASVSCGSNHNPVITSNGGGDSAALTVPENQAYVTTVTATDQDNDPLTFSLSGGVDQAQFMLHPVTGVLSFMTNPLVDQPNDSNGDNIYQVQVQVSDGQGGIDRQDLAITVTRSNAYKVLEYTIRRAADNRYHVYMRPNRALAANNNYNLTGQITLTVPHGTGANRFTVTNLQTHIPNVVWSQTSRVDAPTENASVDYLSFTFNPYGTQEFQWQKDLELDIFSFENSASCSGLVGVMENSDPFNQLPNSRNTQPTNQFTNLGWGSMTANNYLGNYGDPVDCSTNQAPTIVSNGGGDTATITVADQQTSVTTVMATDPDNDTLTYSIIGGVDAGLFLINPSTGRLSFSTTPNFDSPQDANADNTYLVDVQASDGRGGIDQQALTIRVIKSDSYKVLEYTVRRGADKRYHIYMRPTRDPSAGLNYNLTGQITLTVPTGAGANKFVVTDLRSEVVNVTWANNSRVDAPTENTSTDYLSFTFSPYGHQDFNWQAGVEIDMFSFVNNNTCSGVVDVMENTELFAQMPNSANTRPANQFTNLGWGPATANNYLGNYGDPVDCRNNADPVITSDGGGDTATLNVLENSVAVTTVTATDPDNDVLTFSITGGVDAAKFALHPSTGVLTFITAPDYEIPTDANLDNRYELQVTVEDGRGGIDRQTITVVVGDVFENLPPVIISDGGGDVANLSVIEGRTHATTVVATDGNNDVLTYSIIGGADAAKFTLDPATGVLSFKSPPSMGGQAPWGDVFLPPGDIDKNNVYVVEVQALDPHGAADTQIINLKLITGLVLQLQVRAWLQGPFDPNTQMMRDSLRTKGLISLQQPFNIPPFIYQGGESLSASLLLEEGFDAPVDWVLIQLRSATSPAAVLWSKAALIQRDGDIVDPATGSNRITVENAPSGRYYLAVQHRNHLGVVSASTVLLENTVATWYDFGLTTTSVMGNHSRLLNTSKAFLWAGDANYDKKVAASGTTANDLSVMRNAILGAGANNTASANYKLSGYQITDFNLDGITTFSGAMNDLNPLVANIINHPANTTKSGDYILIGNLP